MISPRHDDDHPDPADPGSCEPVTADTTRRRDPDFLLTVVPYLLGYHPSPGDVVIAALRQDDTLELLTRIDLPAPQDPPAPHDAHAAWACVIAPLHLSGAAAVVVIAYTDDDAAPQIRTFIDAAPLPVRDVLRVHRGRYWTFPCRHRDCTNASCGPDGVAVTQHLEVAATFIATGAAVADTRSDLARFMLPGPALLIQAVTALLAGNPSPPRQVLLAAITQAHDARLGGPQPIPPWQAAVLLQGLSDALVRDTCAGWDDDAAWWLWSDLIRTAPPGWVAPVAALIAATTYQRGNTVLAAIATDHALRADPTQLLAGLIQGCLRRAVPPKVFHEFAAQAAATARNLMHQPPQPKPLPRKEIPMGIHARIEPGGSITIDTHAWLEPRTAGTLDDLTTDLRHWADTSADTSSDIGADIEGDGVGPRTVPSREAPMEPREWVTAARAWCEQRNFTFPEPDLIVHTESRLATNLWIVRAHTDSHGPIAIVGIDHDPPHVYTDYCTDSWDWFDADTIDITCPAGHGWTWRTGRELITADLRFATVTGVFGPGLDAPFTPCPNCAAYSAGERSQPCGCDGTPWILCPTCGRRCDVELNTH